MYNEWAFPAILIFKYSYDDDNERVIRVKSGNKGKVKVI